MSAAAADLGKTVNQLLNATKKRQDNSLERWDAQCRETEKRLNKVLRDHCTRLDSDDLHEVEVPELTMGDLRRIHCSLQGYNMERRPKTEQVKQ